MDRLGAHWELLECALPADTDALEIWARARTTDRPHLWYRGVAVNIDVRESPCDGTAGDDGECRRQTRISVLTTACEAADHVLRTLPRAWELPECVVLKSHPTPLLAATERADMIRYLGWHLHRVARDIDAAISKSGRMAPLSRGWQEPA